MNKFSHEYMKHKVNQIYRRLDNTSMSICSLKNDLDEILRILEAEYNKKYKKPAKK